MTAPRLPVRNLLRIASDLEVSDPFLAYELEQDVLSLSGLRKVRKAVINPGVQTWEEHVENMVAVLKSLGQELTKVLNEVETLEELKDIDEAIKKFKVLFEDLDADGNIETGEPPLFGWTINLYEDLDGDGVLELGTGEDDLPQPDGFPLTTLTCSTAQVIDDTHECFGMSVGEYWFTALRAKHY
ncbi:hypothetical protein LCGC14_2953390, partial [marine sediment metagenome]